MNVRSALCLTRAPRLLLALLLALVVGPALAAGGPYAVEDSGVNDPGECKLETWHTRGSNGDHLTNVSPACTFAALSNVEWGLTVTRARLGGSYNTLIAPQIKISIVPVDRFGVGVGFFASGTYATGSDLDDAATALVPFTVAPIEEVRLSANLGWAWDRAGHRHRAFSGLGGEWQVHPRLAVIAETYGQDSGRWGKQFGLRPTLIEGLLDLDLVFGRDIDGTRSNWFTVGGSLRF